MINFDNWLSNLTNSSLSSTDPESDDTRCQTRKQIVSRVKIALSTHAAAHRGQNIIFLARFNCSRLLDAINELPTDRNGSPMLRPIKIPE